MFILSIGHFRNYSSHQSEIYNFSFKLKKMQLDAPHQLSAAKIKFYWDPEKHYAVYRLKTDYDDQIK